MGEFLSGKFRILLILGWIPLLVWSGGCKVRAQKTSREGIRTAYQEVNARIATCQEDGSPCGLYVNRLTTNSGEEPWAAVGIYQSKRDLWYQRDPESEEEKYQLLKVNATTQRSDRVENEEYLFATSGKLIFYYFRLEQGDELLQEYRYYFSEDKLIDYQEKLAEGETEYREMSQEGAAQVLEKAAKMRILWEASL